MAHMAWKKASPELVATFESVLPGAPAEPRKMFGYPCAFVNGNMFMGLHEERLILRLGDDERAKLLAVKGAVTFEPMKGRPMREYVVVPPSVLKDGAALRGWVKKSLAFAESLPKKTKAKPKTRSRKG